MAVTEVEVLPDPAGRGWGIQRRKRRKVDVQPTANGLDVTLLPNPQANERPVSRLSTKRRKARPFGIGKARLQHAVVNRHDPLDVATDLRVRYCGHHAIVRVRKVEVKTRRGIEEGLAKLILVHRQGIRVKSPFSQHLPQKKPSRDRTATVSPETERVTFASSPRRKAGVRRLIRRVIRQNVGDPRTIDENAPHDPPDIHPLKTKNLRTTKLTATDTITLITNEYVVCMPWYLTSAQMAALPHRMA